MRKEAFIFKANRKREIATLIVNCAYGSLIGYEASISIYSDTPTDEGGLGPSLGYVLIILLAPVAVYQVQTSLVTEMGNERQRKMRETLKILGLNSYVYAIAHLSIRMFFASFLSIILAVFIYVFNLEHMAFGQFIALVFAFLFLAYGSLTLVLIL